MKYEVGVWAVGALWLAAILAAGYVWERYDATPGPAEVPVAAAPIAKPSGWRLTVYVHPRCPCSRATIQQTIALAGECPHLSVRVVFVRPPNTPAGWERGELWEQAERLLGATVTCDVDGVEARSVGAETSGAAVLTDPTGQAVFLGGLTSSRGRDGEGAGRRVVRGWVRGEAAVASSPVYGCPLHTPDE